MADPEKLDEESRRKLEKQTDVSVTEYGLLMSGGGVHIRSASPELERIYPTAEWAKQVLRDGAHVMMRTVTVVEDWTDYRDPDCEKCDTDTHRCPGCSEPLRHGQGDCGAHY